MRGVVLRVVTVLVSRDVLHFALQGMFIFCLVFLSEGNLEGFLLGTIFNPFLLRIFSTNRHLTSACQYRR